MKYLILLLALSSCSTGMIKYRDCNYIQDKQSYAANMKKCIGETATEERVLYCMEKEREFFGKDGFIINNQTECIKKENK